MNYFLLLHLCSVYSGNHYREQSEIAGLISKAPVAALCRIGIVEMPPLLPAYEQRNNLKQRMRNIEHLRWQRKRMGLQYLLGINKFY